MRNELIKAGFGFIVITALVIMVHIMVDCGLALPIITSIPRVLHIVVRMMSTRIVEFAASTMIGMYCLCRFLVNRIYN